MGILSWWKKGDNNKDTTSSSSNTTPVSKTTTEKPNPIVSKPAEEDKEVPGMNGAMEVTRPGPNVDVTVFEFGSIAASNDNITLAGYCPVSDDLEPCRWEILPGTTADAPQFRIVF